MKLQPLADRVIVEPLNAEEVTKGGIVIPDTAKEKPAEGKIVAVGRSDRTNDRDFTRFFSSVPHDFLCPLLYRYFSIRICIIKIIRFYGSGLTSSVLNTWDLGDRID